MVGLSEKATQYIKDLFKLSEDFQSIHTSTYDAVLATVLPVEIGDRIPAAVFFDKQKLSSGDVMKASTYLQIAYLISQESKCCSWKVGAVIEKNGRIISTGYNLLKEHRMAHAAWSSKNEIHAELNAILFAARTGSSIDGATMYVTLSPCADCAKSIAQSGIKTLVYAELYDRNPEGWDDILRESGIEVIQYNRTGLRSLNWESIQNYCGE
ncbi:deoxycytidylate deaminase [Escherichia phage vB_EcoM_005]|uniref:Deoxycytidylate deaminase n=1 Tax=Escherichia phage vB_EcoM_005 TaxID=2500761 RepID=A0A3T0ILK0_9CAUD|nr:deoxycytidylate deaminase [Escherichia phage vB_EcoM_005]AZV00901.1 deoxycytidylate deaminase [Escherichia phage vB_EcoM_005]